MSASAATWTTTTNSKDVVVQQTMKLYRQVKALQAELLRLQQGIKGDGKELDDDATKSKSKPQGIVHAHVQGADSTVTVIKGLNKFNRRVASEAKHLESVCCLLVFIKFSKRTHVNAYLTNSTVSPMVPAYIHFTNTNTHHYILCSLI